MLLGHLSDLHLRDADDVAALGRQLDRIVARNPAHLVITGDLLDRWDPSLLRQTLDALEARGLLDPARLTLVHGNHDLASSGGYPRDRRDAWRLAWRFWDPPPLIAARKRRFYQMIDRRVRGVASPAPWAKPIADGVRVAALDTVPVHWWPLGVSSRVVTVKHALGCLRAAELEWLHSLDVQPTILALHHYPLDAPQFAWRPDRVLGLVVDEVRVPMMIPEGERRTFWRAAGRAGVRLVLCGHVHRARLEWHDGMAVGLNGQSGAAWAGRTIAFYDVRPDGITASFENGD